jgi:hypothetical protein
LKKSNLRDSVDQTLEKLTVWLVRSYRPPVWTTSVLKDFLLLLNLV